MMNNSERAEHLAKLKDYLDEPRRGLRVAAPPFLTEEELSEFKNTELGFADALLSMIDAKGLKDSDVYKKADISRSVFCNVKSGHFSRGTAIALTLTMQLGLAETEELLRKGNIVLSESYVSDKVIIYCIKNKIYDANDVNYLLNQTDQPILREMR